MRWDLYSGFYKKAMNLICEFYVPSVDAKNQTAPTTQCEYYNETLCNESGTGCNTTQVCDKPETDKRNHCYVLWQNNTNGIIIKMKGNYNFGHNICDFCSLYFLHR